MTLTGNEVTMNKRCSMFSIAAICCLFMAVSAVPIVRTPSEGILFYAKYTYQDNTAAVGNPWIAGAVFQIYWSEVETSEGVFDWETIDSWIKPWTQVGKKVALRVLWSGSGYWPDPSAKAPTPSWVWAKGAIDITHAPSGTQIPLFWDPIYIHHALQFVSELSRKFDQDTNVLFLDITPGAETNPYRFGTIDDNDTSFRSQFIAKAASDGRTYSDSLWTNTVQHFIDSTVVRFASLPLLVTLNSGGMPGGQSHLSSNGEYAVDHGMYAGQNGLRGTSYATDTPSRRSFLSWSDRTATFFEMFSATGSSEGTMREVIDAAVRVGCDYLNVYPSDVLKGTAGQGGYDTSFANALQYGAEALAGGATSAKNKSIAAGELRRTVGPKQQGWADLRGRQIRLGNKKDSKQPTCLQRFKNRLIFW